MRTSVRIFYCRNGDWIVEMKEKASTSREGAIKKVAKNFTSSGKKVFWAIVFIISTAGKVKGKEKKHLVSD